LSPEAALAVYVHWPYCARICPYCDFNVVRERGRVDEQRILYRAILADLDRQAALTGPRRLVSVFFGGGTPSLMDPDRVGDIVARAKALWSTDGPVEVTLEANPTDVESGRFAAFAQAGVDRLSLGVQSLDDGALKFLGRNHDAAQGRRAALLARGLFRSLSLDAIYARPGQSVAAWTRELNEFAALGPDHLSPYQLTIEPGTPFDRAVRRKVFNPRDPEASARLYEATQAVLESRGFAAYEVSNHARPGAEARHNLAYWRGEDYVGAGPGAHGRLTLDGARTATVAPAGIPAYVRAVGDGVFESRETLSMVEAAEERLMMGLRVSEGVHLADLQPLALARLDDLVEAGLLVRREGRIAATAAGRLVLDRVIEELAV
jgi:putative oxygen-independent coproporphyrinogen III oxidase